MTYSLYADEILFHNFLMDYLLLLAVKRALKLEKRRGGLFAGSLAGASYALAVTIFPLPIPLFQAFLTYGGMSFLMVLLAFRIVPGGGASQRGKLPESGEKTVRRRARTANVSKAARTAALREAAKAVAALYLASLLTGGAAQLLWGRFSVSVTAFWPVTALLAASAWLAGRLWGLNLHSTGERGRLYRVEIFYKERTGKFTAFLDTGNRLTEPITGQAVSILYAGSGKELFQTVENVRYLPFRTVGREDGVIPAVQADRMEIEEEGRRRVVEKPFIAISKAPLSGDNTYQMLLNEKLFYS